MKQIKISINTPTIKLDQFLKWANIVSSGGEAKIMIQNEQVMVNGEIITQRGKSLKAGDIITYGEQSYLIE